MSASESAPDAARIAGAVRAPLRYWRSAAAR